MFDPKKADDGIRLSDRATLRMLTTLEEGEALSQRGLATRIGVALGMTNSLLKRAVRKGLLKVKHAPAKRYAYYLTPKGMGEKSRLVAEYLSTSLVFFRQAREEYSEIYGQVKDRNHKRIALYGAGELVEIALLSAQERDVEVLAVINPGSNQKDTMGLPVVNSVEAASDLELDAVVITCARAPQEAYNLLVGHFEAERVFAAPLLHVVQKENEDGE